MLAFACLYTIPFKNSRKYIKIKILLTKIIIIPITCSFVEYYMTGALQIYPNVFFFPPNVFTHKKRSSESLSTLGKIMKLIDYT